MSPHKINNHNNKTKQVKGSEVLRIQPQYLKIEPGKH